MKLLLLLNRPIFGLHFKLSLPSGQELLLEEAVHHKRVCHFLQVLLQSLSLQLLGVLNYLHLLLGALPHQRQNLLFQICLVCNTFLFES